MQIASSIYEMPAHQPKADMKIERWQAEKLNRSLFHCANLLIRLRGRMVEVGFIPTDRLYQLVCDAQDAVQALTVELHYQSCAGGVGRSPDENQKTDSPPSA